jgi:hypothetical protein
MRGQAWPLDRYQFHGETLPMVIVVLVFIAAWCFVMWLAYKSGGDL